MKINQFGLSRSIPARVKQEVRRRSKFGCVVCRCAISQYEHIDPVFVEAHEHDPEKICLLCGRCHDQVTRGRLSKESVRNAYRGIQQSDDVVRSYEKLDLASFSLTVSIGTSKFIDPYTLIEINGEEILSVKAPAEGASYPTLNGVFYDQFGMESFRIAENIWEGPSNAWDIVLEGRRLTIKCEKDRVALVMEVLPPNEVRITHLNMYKDNCHIMCHDGELLIGQIHQEDQAYIGLGSFKCWMARRGIAVDSRQVDRPQFEGMSINNDDGIHLMGTGIKVGVGAVNMLIGMVHVWQLES